MGLEMLIFSKKGSVNNLHVVEPNSHKIGPNLANRTQSSWYIICISDIAKLQIFELCPPLTEPELRWSPCFSTRQQNF